MRYWLSLSGFQKNDHAESPFTPKPFHGQQVATEAAPVMGFMLFVYMPPETSCCARITPYSHHLGQPKCQLKTIA